jgi:hypothetical protein
VCVLPDDMRVVSGSQDNTLRVWNILTGDCERELITAVSFVCALPNVHRVVSINTRTLSIWDAWTGECLQELEHFRNPPQGDVCCTSDLLQVSQLTNFVVVLTFFF